MRLTLEVRDLSCRHGRGRLAIEGVSFAIHAGQVVGVLGPNGAGKTTLLEAVTGLLPVVSGTIRVTHGERSPVPQASVLRDEMLYLPDIGAPFEQAIVHDVLTFWRAAFRIDGSTMEEMTESLDIREVLRSRMATLSKGFRRRVLLALALSCPRRILLLDEPFDGLDLRQTRRIMTILRAQAASGRALLLSIHQISDASRLCDAFVLLGDGRVRGRGTLDQLLAQAGLAEGTLEDAVLALA